MARRRGTELRTDFTGNDADFKKKVENNISGAKKFGDSWEKSGKRASKSVSTMSKGLDSLKKKAGLAALAVGAIALAKKGLTEDLAAATAVDDMKKLSDATGESFVRFQRQASAAKKANIELQEYANTLQRVTRKGQEAKAQPGGGVDLAFGELGIAVDPFTKLSPADRILALAEAYKKAPDKDRAFAQLFKIMEDDAKKFRAFFEQGAAGIRTAELDAVGIASDEMAKNAAGFLDQQEDDRLRKQVNDVRNLGGVKNIAWIKRQGTKLRETVNRTLNKDMGGGKAASDIEAINAALKDPVPADQAKKTAAAIGSIVKATKVSKGGGQAFDIPALMGIKTGGREMKPSDFPGLDNRSFPGLDALAKLKSDSKPNMKKAEKAQQKQIGILTLINAHVERFGMVMEKEL